MIWMWVWGDMKHDVVDNNNNTHTHTHTHTNWIALPVCVRCSTILLGNSRSGQVLTLFWMSLSIVGPPWLLPTTTSGLNFCIAAAWVRTCVEWIRQILAAAWIHQSFTLTTVAKSLVCLTYSWWFELRCRVQEVKSYSAKREMQARPSWEPCEKRRGPCRTFPLNI